MNAKDAVDWLDDLTWRDTPATHKLGLLKEVQSNLNEHLDALAKADLAMKGIPLDDELYGYQAGLGYQGTAVPVGSTIAACIDLYKSLKEGAMPKPVGITRVSADLYDVQVFPRTAKERLTYPDRTEYLRVRGAPRQVNPLSKPGGIIGVLGAGNYSSSVEMLNALFLENSAVVHKPHHLNETTDRIWAQIMRPLVDYRALSFCEASEGQALIHDHRLRKIYFTGGAASARAIMATTDTDIVSECGGNNPCIVVPGDSAWTPRQIRHQALQIATMAKLNGGAVCGRPQTLVTSKRWLQREEFLEELKSALQDETPAASSYYPGSEEAFETFRKEYPEAQVIEPEHGRLPKSTFLFIDDVAEDSYAVQHEAFCQVLDEVALDTPAVAGTFLEKAVAFCNHKLLGTLASTIVIDDGTAKRHRDALENAVADLEYGSVGVNTMPPFIFLSPYLTWGGHEEGKALVSGRGNFGNVLCFANVDKSIVYSDFMSLGHMMSTNKKAWFDLSKRAAHFAAHPSWFEWAKMTGTALAGKFRHRDF